MIRPTILAALALAAAGSALGQPVLAPAGQARLLSLGAHGVQVYACEARDAGFAWVFKGPEAVLFDEAGREVGSHGAGPFWRLADGSRVEGDVTGNAPSPEAGAIPWLLLRTRAKEGEGALARVDWIRRIDTRGGLAPRDPCDAGKLGSVARMRYSAVYEFLGG